jgi:hypothetical protein
MGCGTSRVATLALPLELPVEMNYLGCIDKAVKQAPPGLAEQFAISEAGLARGETVPASVVHDAICAVWPNWNATPPSFAELNPDQRAVVD